MAKAPARRKAAASASSGTTAGSGITTREISELRDMFSTGRSSSHTGPSPTPSWSVTSKPSAERRKRDSLPPRTRITVEAVDGSVITIEADLVEISFDRDFQDVTTWADPGKVYLVNKGTFTIKGSL